ncbi:MAG: hypothetical protein LLG04_18220 [Parachlamydia sp.]|nr:hypothetical protein [Parachlamydia sp.]
MTTDAGNPAGVVEAGRQKKITDMDFYPENFSAGIAVCWRKMNIQRVNPQDLSVVTYNSADLRPLKPDHSNLYMGIGLWSLKQGLSHGLPVDVMQMLLAAKLLQATIQETHRERSPKVIILIADSMALREGADRNKVEQIVQIYKRSLEPLLRLLKMESEIVLSSELEQSPPYAEALENVDRSPLMHRMEVEDRVHHAYMRTQTAITACLHRHRGVGVKVGWLNSIKHANAQSWDELKFDRFCQLVCPDLSMQYLYAKAGLKHLVNAKHVNLKESCPYTAYPQDRRYVVQVTEQKPIKDICLLGKGEANHWKGVAEVCSRLMEAGLVSQELLPRGCIQKSNAITTVYSMLNHWSQILAGNRVPVSPFTLSTAG